MLPNSKEILDRLDKLQEKKNTLMKEYSSSKYAMDELYKIRKTTESTWVRRWRDKSSSLFSFYLSYLFSILRIPHYHFLIFVFALFFFQRCFTTSNLASMDSSLTECITSSQVYSPAYLNFF